MKASIFDQDNIEYYPDFLPQEKADSAFNKLKTNLEWNEETIKMYGKPVKVPRLVCWYGDKNIQYRYSGINHISLPWNMELLSIKELIEQHTGHHFNSVLGNMYRNENDSMGWHSDDEKELGENPVIASVSLGEERVFKIQHRKSKQILGEALTNGSLLVMSGDFQKQWRHSVPREKTVRKPRINLTFRYVESNVKA